KDQSRSLPRTVRALSVSDKLSKYRGEVSERFKEHAWKACVGEILPWVQIPPSPPFFAFVFIEWLSSTESVSVLYLPFSGSHHLPKRCAHRPPATPAVIVPKDCSASVIRTLL